MLYGFVSGAAHAAVKAFGTGSSGMESFPAELGRDEAGNMEDLVVGNMDDLGNGEGVRVDMDAPPEVAAAPEASPFPRLLIVDDAEGVAPATGDGLLVFAGAAHVAPCWTGTTIFKNTSSH